VEQDEGQRVSGFMRRLSPTVLAATALGALILLIVVMMVIGNRSSDDDRLTGETSASRDDPEARCAAQATYELIKRDLFKRAAALRGSDEAAFDTIAAASSIRVESPFLRDEDASVGSVTCNGTATIDLPPGAAVVGGRRSLSADLLYTIQPAADGSGNVVNLTNADEIVTPLAMLARTAPVDSNTVSNAADAVEPVDPLAPVVQPAPSTNEPIGKEPATAAQVRPSFNCANARTRGELAVCNDGGLASLDRQMGSQFSSALAEADPEQRDLLIRTRDQFLRYRDQCTSNACVAETYRGRMREIRDIMSGDWSPQR
jgi:hypothetical protein